MMGVFCLFTGLLTILPLLPVCNALLSCQKCFYTKVESNNEQLEEVSNKALESMYGALDEDCLDGTSSFTCSSASATPSPWVPSATTLVPVCRKIDAVVNVKYDSLPGTTATVKLVRRDCALVSSADRLANDTCLTGKDAAADPALKTIKFAYDHLSNVFQTTTSVSGTVCSCGGGKTVNSNDECNTAHHVVASYMSTVVLLVLYKVFTYTIMLL